MNQQQNTKTAAAATTISTPLTEAELRALRTIIRRIQETGTLPTRQEIAAAAAAADDEA